jgi:hypothetical protein
MGSACYLWKQGIPKEPPKESEGENITLTFSGLSINDKPDQAQKKDAP